MEELKAQVNKQNQINIDQEQFYKNKVKALIKDSKTAEE
jgi:hypothetical protein